jgi:cobyrinic acid a,c-diamide synthase
MPPPPASSIPRLVVAGVASGVGKTTAMVALTRALQARGLTVATFKCGPDYLDPTHHARATGRPCHTLDGWMMGREAVRATFARASRGCDVALVEGVMGLYDGASPEGEDGSAAQVAKWLEAPVLAVVDAGGMARTVAAVGVGLAAFDPGVRVAGLLANRLGGRGHLALLRRAAAGTPVPVLAGLPADGALALPERHLGLHAATHEALPEPRLDAWGRLFAEWNDLEALLRVAASAPPLEVGGVEDVGVGEAASPRCRIGVAWDAAFSFYYEDNLARLEALGAELVRFSPVADAGLPGGLDALYLGGGYPELHAPALADNAGMREAVRAFAARGGPVYAECGGMMYLAEGLRTLDGRTHAMAGLVPGVAVMSERLQALGYVEVETARTTVLGPPGLTFRGHQFRHSTLEGAPGEGGALRVRRRYDGAVHAEGHGPPHVLASYVHAHWASSPRAAAGLVEAAAAFREARAKEAESKAQGPR